MGQLIAAALIGAIVESTLAGSPIAVNPEGLRAIAFGNAFLLVSILGAPLLAAAVGVRGGRARVEA